jgi:hypothetical protein
MLLPSITKIKLVYKTAYLLAWLILLCNEEVTPMPAIGCYFEVKLRTCKSAQTGVSHTWKLYANDSDVQICPV